MSRKYKINPLPFWCTAEAGRSKSKHFAQVDITLLEHPNFIKLGKVAQLVYIRMVAMCGGHREFYLTYDKHGAGFCKKAFYDAVKELEGRDTENGRKVNPAFISKTSGINQYKKNCANQHKPSTYRFENEWWIDSS